MELAAMVPSATGGSADLYFPVVAYVGFSQSICLHLYVCNRSLAILGLPGNHFIQDQPYSGGNGPVQAGFGNQTRRSTLQPWECVDRERPDFRSHGRISAGVTNRS